MSYPINYPTPQGADIQIFYATRYGAITSRYRQSWIKPQGASFIWFTLIGAGGSGGDATSDGVSGSTARGGGGGSGGITNCLVPAFLIPDELNVVVGAAEVGAGGQKTLITYLTKNDNYDLLSADAGSVGGNASASGGVANNGTGGAGGAANSSNYFSAIGFYQSIAGQNGTAGASSQTTSTTTFVQGGVGGAGNSAASPYGYTKASLGTAGISGFGMLQPIINSVSSNDAGSLYGSRTLSQQLRSGFGCGGGGAIETGAFASTNYGGIGGNGLVVIISW